MESFHFVRNGSESFLDETGTKPGHQGHGCLGIQSLQQVHGDVAKEEGRGRADRTACREREEVGGVAWCLWENEGGKLPYDAVKICEP